MSAKLQRISACQENLLHEMVFKVHRLKKEATRIKERVASEASSLAEKKVVDLKALKRDLEAKFADLEQSLHDNLLVAHQRTLQLEDMEYELKYKQARATLLTKDQIEKLDEDIKLLEKPMSLELVEVKDLKFRLVLDFGSQQHRLDHALFDAGTYTFDDNHAAGKKLPANLQRQTAHNLDLVSENCKLESIIEQYREENERLKAQFTQWKTTNCKLADLFAVLKAAFEDLRARLQAADSTAASPSNSTAIHKVADAIDSREENYLRDSLREFVQLVCGSAARTAELEAAVRARDEELAGLRKSHELLDFELRDVMRTAQVICNPDSDQPVNLYQMKLELRHKLRQIEDFNAAQEATAALHALHFSTDHKKTSAWDPDNKENLHPNRQSTAKAPHATIFQTLEDTSQSVQTLPIVPSQPARHPTQKPPGRPAALSSLNKIGLLRASTLSHTSHLKSVASQAMFPDQDLFPPFDYRKCLRCGLNDILAPGFCKYQTLSAQTDANNMVSLTNKDRVSDSHSYKHREELARDPSAMLLFKKTAQDPPEPTKEAATQTVVGLAEARTMRKGHLVDYRHIDKALLSPKDI